MVKRKIAVRLFCCCVMAAWPFLMAGCSAAGGGAASAGAAEAPGQAGGGESQYAAEAPVQAGGGESQYAAEAPVQAGGGESQYAAEAPVQAGGKESDYAAARQPGEESPTPDGAARTVSAHEPPENAPRPLQLPAGGDFTVEPEPGNVFSMSVEQPNKDYEHSFALKIRRPGIESGALQNFSFRAGMPLEQIKNSMKSEDINFDSYPDLVIMTSNTGNHSYEVFLWDTAAQKFSPWYYSGLLADYRLFPSEKVIYNRVVLSAGERRELYRPDRKSLLLLRAYRDAGEEAESDFYSASSGETASSGDREDLSGRFQAVLSETEREMSMISQPNYEGKWNRTNVVRGLSAVLEVTDQTEYGFRYAIDASYYSHVGTVEGIAYFLPGRGAFSEYHFSGDSDILGGERIILTFQIREDGQMTIVCAGSGSGLGVGANVTVDGSYTRGEPVYANADVVGDHFNKEQLRDIKLLLGDEVYEEFFIFPLEYGVLEEEDVEGNIPGHLYRVRFPTMGGYEFGLLFGENEFWYFANPTTGFLTEDQRDTVPDALAEYLR